jgi:uncharacterized protein (DUF1330 family)
MNTKLNMLFALTLVATGALLGGLLPMGDGQVTAQEAEAEKDASFSMLNALWFNEEGGAEKYGEYLEAAAPFVAKHGGTAGDAYIPTQAIIGTFDADLVFFVNWPNEAAFTGLLSDPGYQAISHLRGEAITDSLLIRCDKQ